MLKSMILEYLDAQPNPDWVKLTQFLRDCGYSDLTNIRSALMQMENDKLLQFRPGSFHKKLGLHERLNPDDYKNSYITLDNIPLLDAKIRDEGSQKIRDEKAAAGRRRLTEQLNNKTPIVPDPSPQPFQGPFEPANLISDEEIPARNRAKLMATLMLLRNKGLVKSDNLGLKYTVTWRGRLDRLYRYKGWGAVAAVICLVGVGVAYFAWVHPFTAYGSKPKPVQVDTMPQRQNINIGRGLPDLSLSKKASVDSMMKGGAK